MALTFVRLKYMKLTVLINTVKGTKIADTILLLEDGICIPIVPNCFDKGTYGWWLFQVLRTSMHYPYITKMLIILLAPKVLCLQ